VGDILLMIPFRILAQSDDDGSSMCLAHSSNAAPKVLTWCFPA
jgi:hypothetical protein